MYLKAFNEAEKNYTAAESNGSGEKFQIRNDFYKEYDAWDKKNPHIQFVLGSTSKALQTIGIADKRIVMDSSKIIKIKVKHPEMTDKVIKQIPALLENPIVIMQSKTKSERITMFGEVFVNGNEPVLVALELYPTKRGIAVDEIKVASAYKKDNAQAFINSSKILYVDENKKRVEKWTSNTRLYLPVNDAFINSDIIKSQKNNNVNTKIRENTKNIQKNTKNEQKKFSLRENYNENTDFTANINNVVKMDSVRDMTGGEFAKGESDLITQVSKYFDSIGNVVHSKYGDIVLNRTGAKTSIGHGIGRNKAVAFTAVPNVIEKGEIINYHTNYKGRGYDTAVFAAPITINNVPYFMAAVVTVEKSRNLYYLHEVALQKKEDTSPFKTGTGKAGTPSDEISSIHTLLQNLQNVNSNNSIDNADLREKRKLSERFPDYYTSLKDLADIFRRTYTFSYRKSDIYERFNELTKIIDEEQFAQDSTEYARLEEVKQRLLQSLFAAYL